MGHLISTGSCPFCGQGVNTPCFATYSDGYKCFTCGKTKHTGALELAYKTHITHKIELKVPEYTENIQEFSPNVLQWLYKYYVYDDLIKKYRISYVKYNEYGVFKGESLLLPVIQDDEMVFYQQRFFPNKQFITKGEKSSIFYIPSETNTVVLVEDYISAIRLGEFTNVICLFGTHMNYDVMKFINYLNMNVAVWLDPDEAGQKGAKEIASKLEQSMLSLTKWRAFSVRESRTVKIIKTEKQPKELCNQELNEILRGIHATQ